MKDREINLRPQLAQHLRQRLHAFGDGFRQNLALIGPPGSGKTFQLQHLVSLPPANLLVIYCALYRESCRASLHRLMGSILQTGLCALDGAGDPKRPAHAVPPRLEDLLRQAESSLPKTAAAASTIEGLLARHLYSDAFNRTLELIPILVEEQRKPCVFILDEFLCLEEMGLLHAFHELGKRVMTWPTTLFVLSSSSPYRARTILRERLQLLFGQFELLTLETLDPAVTTPWVAQQLKGVRGTKLVNVFFSQWLGAYPWYLSVFLKRLKELAALGRHAEVTDALVLQTAWDVLGRVEGPLHQWCVSRVEALMHERLGPRALDGLLHIAHGVRTSTEIGKRIGRAGLSSALQLLIEHDLVQRNGMCWMVTDPILKCWLSTVFAAQRSDAPLSEELTRRCFDQYLHALWAQWIQARQLSFPQQVAELFNQFAEDTVSLDAKTGRLPKFESIVTQQPTPSSPQVVLIAEGQGRRWCAAIQESSLDESAIANFDAFCRTQTPRPSRKIVVTKTVMDQNARLLAKAANMWVWETEELGTLLRLFGRF